MIAIKQDPFTTTIRAHSTYCCRWVGHKQLNTPVEHVSGCSSASFRRKLNFPFWEINGKRGITVQNCNSNLKKYVSVTYNVLQFDKLLSKTLEIGVSFYLVLQLH